MDTYEQHSQRIRPCDLDLIEASVCIQERNPWKENEVQFMPKHLVITTLPHRKIAGSEYARVNGRYRLTILSPSNVGIPYGMLPRMIMVWLTSEAVVTKSREIELGDSLSCFMRKIDLVPTGGKKGTITRLKNQVGRLFSSTISLQVNGDGMDLESGFRVADRHMIFWSGQNPGQRDMWSSSVQLSESFYDVITSNPVPLDLAAVKALKGSPMAFDIYCWMTHRFYYLGKITHISWPDLSDQFGSSYTRLRDFKRAFDRELKRVSVLYPDAKFKITENKLILYPSKTHVSRRRLESCF